MQLCLRKRHRIIRKFRWDTICGRSGRASVACTPRHVSTQQHVTGYKSLLGSSYPRDPARFVHRANVPWFDGASSSQMHHQSVMNSVDQDKEFIPQSFSQSVSAGRFLCFLCFPFISFRWYASTVQSSVLCRCVDRVGGCTCDGLTLR
jgi:hypothetical protein